MHRQLGFTLIELLVVVAIIGVLSSLAVVSLGDARNKAYDAQIKSDISQMRTSIELYALDNETGFSGWTVPTQFSLPACSGDKVAGYKKTISDSAYIIWADLCAEESSDFCVDSTGFAGVVPALGDAPATCK